MENTEKQQKPKPKNTINASAPGSKFDYDAHMKQQLFIAAVLVAAGIGAYFLLAR